MTQAWLLVLALLLLPAPTREEAELFGRPLPDLRGRPAVVLYTNQATGKATNDPLTELSFRLRDLHPMILVRVDLGGIPKLFTGFARSNMRKEYFQGLRRYDQLCREAHLPLPAPGTKAASFFMSFDRVGAPHRALGLPQGFHTALAIAYDAEGREIARVPFPQGAAALERALRASATAHPLR